MVLPLLVADFFSKHFGYNIKESALPLIVIYALVTVLSILGHPDQTGKPWMEPEQGQENLHARLCRRGSGDLVQYFTCGPSWRCWGWREAHQVWSASVHAGFRHVPEVDVASITGLSGMAGRFALCCSRRQWALPVLVRRPGKCLPWYDIIFMVCGSAYLAAFVIFSLIIPNINMVAPRER
ncbi:MAG: hypothetical protein ACLT8E_01430 [Akkermansia sp.]